MTQDPTPAINPYQAPAAARAKVRRVGFWRSVMGECVQKWLLLGVANALLGGLLGLGWYGSGLANLAGMALGFYLLLTAVVYVDYSLRQSDRLPLSQALRRAAVYKALLQFIFIPDMMLGALASGIVWQILGRTPFLSVFATTLLYGAFVFAAIFLIIWSCTGPREILPRASGAPDPAEPGA